ncbi:unnamed protein product [Polarella glacialis]|uniref:Uncharacterized protein n=1 Tax=Polarella glacialis TaxID=89957 RepID=A0A813HS90_POLGL|nr:unnamed protein product [Polarella glacialis]CAE8715654.1 unnamed protein product [Polarella glacialis]
MPQDRHSSQSAGLPLLGGDAPSAPAIDLIADVEPSAPPGPVALSQEELQKLLRELPKSAECNAGASDLPTEKALRIFQAATAGRLLWTAQLREIASAVVGGGQFLREAYERQLLLDPEALTVSDGPWVQQAVSSSSQAAQAFLSRMTVIRFDGAVAEVSVDLAQTSGLEVAQLASSRLTGEVFDPSKHVLFGIGRPASAGITVGSIVKLTGLVSPEALNGQVGQVVSCSALRFNVLLPSGVHCVDRDNVVLQNATVVSRCSAYQLDLAKRLDCFSGIRLLWLEARPLAALVSGQVDGPLKSIRHQVLGMGISGTGLVSVGEFRNFLWNLHLDDASFALVQKRFAPQGVYVDMDEVHFLLGRSHLQSSDVPVVALIYEAVVSILGRRTTAHIDRSLGDEDKGVGLRGACRKHCVSYTFSFVLQAVVLFNLAVLLVWVLRGVQILQGPPDQLAWGTLVVYLVYLGHLLFCVRLTKAFANETHGLEQVMQRMDRPRHETPHYSWRVQCYHYETRTVTTKDKDGESRTDTETHRVNTHSAYTSGVIPSTDSTPAFLPNTAAAQTQIATHLDLDFSDSNYIGEYHRWCSFHRWDLHQDCSKSEDLPSRLGSCLALWSPRRKPCWMNACCYWLANLFLLSFFYRIFAQSRFGHQEYTYEKKCGNIPTHSGGTAAVGAALLATGLGLAAGGLV